MMKAAFVPVAKRPVARRNTSLFRSGRSLTRPTDAVGSARRPLRAYAVDALPSPTLPTSGDSPAMTALAATYWETVLTIRPGAELQVLRHGTPRPSRALPTSTLTRVSTGGFWGSLDIAPPASTAFLASPQSA